MKRNPLELTPSRQFAGWLGETGISLAFTTGQTGKLFLIGLNTDGALSVVARSFARCMGIHATESTLWVGTLYQLWRLENALQAGQTRDGFDRLYVPHFSHTTGDLDVHDVAVDAEGSPMFINTLFSCIARPDPRYSFRRLWAPPFVSKLAAEDRCHLNGLSMRNGQPAYATLVGPSDVGGGWREHRVGGGQVWSVTDDELICNGLSMPHSPRWHKGRLWLLNSGTGHVGYVDNGRFEPVAFCPGYLRGLNFVGNYAIVGLSKPREDSAFGEFPLGGSLARKRAGARCALQVVDLQRGDVVHELRIDGVIQELYDVAVLPGVKRPMALGFRTDEIRRVLSLAPEDTRAPALCAS